VSLPSSLYCVNIYFYVTRFLNRYVIRGNGVLCALWNLGYQNPFRQQSGGLGYARYYDDDD